VGYEGAERILHSGCSGTGDALFSTAPGPAARRRSASGRAGARLYRPSWR
jgi:hypothetical protein